MNQHRLSIILSIGLFIGILGCYMESGAIPMVKQPVSTVPTVLPARESISFINDYREGLEIARRDSKLVLVFFMFPNSTSSQRMLETTFQDEEIKRLSNRFVCIQIDGSKESQFCQSIDIKGFPTILFMNTQGEEVLRLAGKLNADQLALQMLVMLQTLSAKNNGVIRK